MADISPALTNTFMIGLDAEKSKVVAEAKDQGLSISQVGDGWNLKSSTPLGSFEINFKLGEEFEQAGIDGSKSKVTVVQTGNKWTQTETGSRNVVSEYTLSGDELKLTQTAPGCTAVRTFVRA